MEGIEARIREATRDDTDALARLMDELGYPTSGEEMAERFEAIERDASYGTLVAEYDGAVVGMGGVVVGRAFEFDGVYARLVALVVASEYRGGGVGRALLEACEKWARRRSAHRIMLKQRQAPHPGPRVLSWCRL